MAAWEASWKLPASVKVTIRVADSPGAIVVTLASPSSVASGCALGAGGLDDELVLGGTEIGDVEGVFDAGR